jgi:hypothetical protein
MKHFGSGKYYYTLTPNIDETNDYEKFFFETKSGYCEYYAGMFAILARLQNIPSRIVTGYLAGEYNDLGNFYTFRQSDAHSWVEVYTNDKGWIRFDPTLVIPQENIISFNNSSIKDYQSTLIDEDKKINKLSLLKLYYTYLDYTWTNKFTNYDQKSRDDFLKKKIQNFELKKEFNIFVVSFFLLLIFYKIIKIVINKKLFFTLLFNKIKSKNNIKNNTYTHQEILKLLSIKDKSKMSEIFDIYEKIVFAKNYKPKFKQFFNLNYKIIKLSYFNNSN